MYIISNQKSTLKFVIQGYAVSVDNTPLKPSATQIGTNYTCFYVNFEDGAVIIISGVISPKREQKNPHPPQNTENTRVNPEFCVKSLRGLHKSLRSLHKDDALILQKKPCRVFSHGF